MKINNTTPKQLEIILLLYKFRFLNTHQFKTLLNTKIYDASTPGLKILIIKKIIKTFYVDII